MADTILKLKQIEDFFQNLTLLMLGLNPLAPENQSRVRIGWPVFPSKGSPGWKISEDVAFLLVNFDDDPITRQFETTYQGKSADIADQSTSYTRVIRVSWNFYGPNSFDDADAIRFALPRFTDQLKASNMALILDMTMPLRMPELFAGQWWDRTTFYARFNELVIRHADVPYIQSPDVRIIKG